jgi:hypothetical protein
MGRLLDCQRLMSPEDRAEGRQLAIALLAELGAAEPAPWRRAAYRRAELEVKSCERLDPAWDRVSQSVKSGLAGL